MSETSPIRLWIIETLRRVIDGETLTWSEWEAQPLEGWSEIEPKHRIAVRSEENPEYFAWMALRWWVNDDDIRARDAEYGEVRKRQLRELLELIEQRSVNGETQ